MAKVITVSRTFPAYHPRKGQPTLFVEKILKSLYPDADVTLIVKDIEISGVGGWIKIDGKEGVRPEILAMNDGLSETDLADWFKRKSFVGQLLIWNNNNLPY